MTLAKRIKRTVFFLVPGCGLLLSSPVTAEQFTIAVVPDSQYYTQPDINDPNRTDIFHAQMQWIVDNAATLDRDFDPVVDFAAGTGDGTPEPIIYVAHLGDLVQGTAGGCDGPQSEWAIADGAITRLDTAGIPYSVVAGNHDFDDQTPGVADPVGAQVCTGALTKYNDGYPPAVTGFKPSLGRYGSFHGGTRDNDPENNAFNYTLFQSPDPVNPVRFIAINLSYSDSVDSGALDWMEETLREHSDRHAIITSHYIVGDNDIPNGVCESGNDYGSFGNAIVDRLINHPNVFLMLSGHCYGERWVTLTRDDIRRACLGDVEGMMSGYQKYSFHSPGVNNSGFMRLIKFDTDIASDNVQVRTFSPWVEGVLPEFPPAPLTTTPTQVSDKGSMTNASIANFSFSRDFSLTPRPSVVFMLDTSGSMGAPIPDDASATRLDHAAEATGLFLDLIDQLDSPTRINFALGRFPDFLASGELAAIWPDGLQQWDLSSSRTDADNWLNGLADFGNTPMLAGVELAAEQMSDQHCKAVVLLTDGYHNNPVPVSVGSDELNETIDLIDADSENPVQVYTVGIGGAGEFDEALLNELASRTGGLSQTVTSDLIGATSATIPTGVKAAFKAIFEDLFSDEINEIADPFGIISDSEMPIHEFQVSEFEDKLIILVGWQRRIESYLPFAVYDSTGKPVSPREPGVEIVHRASYSILSIDDRALRAVPGRIGRKPWRIELSSRNLDGGVSEPYHYSVLTRSGLRFDAQINPRVTYAGEQIELSAQLTLGSRPLDLPARLDVVVSAPADGRGNWLARNSVSSGQLAEVPVAYRGESRLAHVRKSIYLREIAGIAYPGIQAADTIRLYDDGTHGDDRPGDGHYVNSFTGTGSEGVYRFLFRARGTTGNDNAFLREKQIETYLGVKPVAEQIGIDVRPLDQSATLQSFTVTVVPRDGLGNFLGPGHGHRIQLAAQNGRFDDPLIDMLDGSYRTVLTTPPDIDPANVVVTATIGDERGETSLSEALGQKDRYGIAMLLGKPTPLGDFDDDFSGNISAGLAMDMHWRGDHRWLLELWQDDFDASSSAGSDETWRNLSASLMFRYPGAAITPYLTAGVGIYDPDDGSSRFGLRVGVGAEVPLDTNWRFDAGLSLHGVDTPGDDTQFLRTHLGIGYRW